MTLKSVIFDFDGVIVESVDIKTEAFRELFKEYPEHVDEIVAYHLENGGMSRYKKFSYIYDKILDQPLDDEHSQKLGVTFSKIVLQKMLVCPFVNGAIKCLDLLSRNNIMLFIASGTPEDELRYIVQMRGLSGYFNGVYGTPSTKSKIITTIMKVHGLHNTEVIFVGDSINDYEGAKKTKVPFIARINKSVVPNPLLDFDLPAVKDLSELNDLLDEDTLL
jgi:phosphoglycolate phosphatase-like HAD superfamily hydrolase